MKVCSSCSEIMLLFVIVFTACVSAQNATGVRVYASQKLVNFLASSEILKNDLYLPLLAGLKFSLPNVTNANISLFSIEVHPLGYNNVTASIVPSKGLSLNFSNFSVSISWDANWRISGKMGNGSGAIILKFNFTALNALSMTASNGLNVTFLDFMISDVAVVSSNSSMLPPEFKDLPSMLLPNLTKQNMASQFNNAIRSYVSTIWETGFYTIIKIKILALGVGIQLFENPVFEQGRMSLGISGNIGMGIGGQQPCDYSHNLPAPNNYDLEIHLSAPCLSCLFIDLNTYAPLICGIETQLFLDPRLYLLYHFITNPLLSFVPSPNTNTVRNIFPVQLALTTTQNIANPGVTVQVNVTAAINISLDALHGSVAVNAGAEVTGLYSDPSANAKLPPIYAAQIKNQDWKALLKQVQDLVDSKSLSLPSIALPNLLANFLQNDCKDVSFATGSDWLVLRANLK